MNNNTLRLKVRLKIKRLSMLLDERVEWNFGYCPNDEYTNSIIDELNTYLNVAKVKFPEIYNDHIDNL